MCKNGSLHLSHNSDLIQEKPNDQERFFVPSGILFMFKVELTFLHQTHMNIFVLIRLIYYISAH